MSMSKSDDKIDELEETLSRGIDRREFMKRTAVGAGALAVGMVMGGCSSTSTAATQSSLAASTETLEFTFAFTADSRLEPLVTDGSLLHGNSAYTYTPSAQDQYFLVNSKAMKRIMDDVQVQKPNMFVFGGDLIFGYNDPAKLAAAGLTLGQVYDRQYGFWRGLVAPLYESGIYVLPVAGNHEVQDKTSAGKVSTSADEALWQSNMKDVILDTARFKQITGIDVGNWDPNNYPTSSTDPAITTIQQYLSYSFDVKNSHFVTINTDAVGAQANFPAGWLDADLAAFRMRNSTGHIFIFGHQPAYTYKPAALGKTNGLDNKLAVATAFWALLDKYKATYFCGHEHSFNIFQDPANTYSGKPAVSQAYQLMIGTAGAPFEMSQDNTKTSYSANPEDFMYGWVKVSVYTSGRVHVDAYGYDENLVPMTPKANIQPNNTNSFDLPAGF